MKCPFCQQPIHIEFSKATPDVGRPLAPRSSAAPAMVDDLAELLDSIEDDALDTAAATFVKDTRERFAKYKEKTRMSDRQMGWLQRIAAGENRRDDWE